MTTIAGTRFWLLIGGLLSFSALAELPAPGQPGAPADPRYCGEPERDAGGKIK